MASVISVVFDILFRLTLFFFVQIYLFANLILRSPIVREMKA